MHHASVRRPPGPPASLRGVVGSSVSKPWFKLWRSTWTDAKILALDPCERWLFLTCLKLAGEGEVEGEIRMPDYAIASAAAFPGARCPRHRTTEALGKVGVPSLLRSGLVRRRRRGVGIVVTNFVHYQQRSEWGGKREGAGRPVKSESRRNRGEIKMNERSERSREVREKTDLKDLPATEGPGTSPPQPPSQSTKRELAMAVWGLYHSRGEQARSDEQLFAFVKAKEADVAAAERRTA